MKNNNNVSAPNRSGAAEATELDTVEKSHFRLCHFCYFLNESPIAVSTCRRCHKPLRNPSDSEQLYHQIAQQIEEDADAAELFAEAISHLVPSGQPLDDSFDQDEDEEVDTAGIQGTIDEVLPLNGLSVVW
ncbi:MAG: hypothetical protein KDD51_03545 [Bdellovibrionales bacterium]|nr:hypothetical protein [Bdellovibrionales bacterium]